MYLLCWIGPQNKAALQPYAYRPVKALFIFVQNQGSVLKN
jgi:hypothetical protein